VSFRAFWASKLTWKSVYFNKKLYILFCPAGGGHGPPGHPLVYASVLNHPCGGLEPSRKSGNNDDSLSQVISKESYTRTDRRTDTRTRQLLYYTEWDSRPAVVWYTEKPVENVAERRDAVQIVEHQDSRYRAHTPRDDVTPRDVTDHVIAVRPRALVGQVVQILTKFAARLRVYFVHRYQLGGRRTVFSISRPYRYDKNRTEVKWQLDDEALRYGTCCREISQFYLHTHAFMHELNEPYPSLPFSRSWFSSLLLLLLLRAQK